MLGGRTATKRFLEVVWNVCAYENAFAISHLSVASLLLVKLSTLQLWNRSISRILYFD